MPTIPYKKISPDLSAGHIDGSVAGRISDVRSDLNNNKPKDHVLVDIKPTCGDSTITAYVHSSLVPER